LIVEFDNLPGCPANQRAAVAASHVRQADLPGVTDIVPAMATLGVHYQPASVCTLAQNEEIPYQTMARVVKTLLEDLAETAPVDSKVVDIPVCYGGEYGLDLTDVAAQCGLSAMELIEHHTRDDVSVLMLGFAPGHPYIGTFDERLSPPRLSQPRACVPAGSVGLANRQSVIYPMALPGGWNLIGRTPLTLFDPRREPPCLLQAGNRVRFVPIPPEAFKTFEVGNEH
jgi:KipI family sensor histidine kinase inhibitor